MAETNYKAKYQQLKAKFMTAVDTAFRLGYEQGAQEAQMDQMMQQQQQQADMEAAAAGQQPGQPGEEGPAGQVPEEPTEEQPPDSAHPGGSELDQHIEKLESMLGKSEEADKGIKFSIDELKKIQVIAKEEIKKSQDKAAFNREMKKSTQAIAGIAKALHKPEFKIGKQATANMSDSAKKAVSMQEKIVNDIFKAWENEGTKATNSIADLINVEGLTKKE